MGQYYNSSYNGTMGTDRDMTAVACDRDTCRAAVSAVMNTRVS